MRSFTLLIVLLSLCSRIGSMVEANFLSGLLGKKEYTPLLFFKVPKGASPECDEMEKIVSELEKEMKIKVQRFDVLKDRMARNLYEKIDEIRFQGKIPLLYHRESLQTVYGSESKARVRAWAKGRWLSPSAGMESGKESNMSDRFLADEMEGEETMNEEYMEEELTDLQQKGRERMIERLEQD